MGNGDLTDTLDSIATVERARERHRLRKLLDDLDGDQARKFLLGFVPAQYGRNN